MYRLWHSRRLDRSQCPLNPCRLYCLVVTHRHYCRSRLCQCQNLSKHRVAHMGWIHFDLYCSTHRCVCFLSINAIKVLRADDVLHSIGVTTRDRPAAAPQTGPYELGYYAIAHTTFAGGIVASLNIFVSSAGTSAFMPVIAEMRQPNDFHKALFVCMGFVTASYLTFSLVVYRWCGMWVASPSLGVSIACSTLRIDRHTRMTNVVVERWSYN